MHSLLQYKGAIYIYTYTYISITFLGINTFFEEKTSTILLLIKIKILEK